jgi:hypothetical protein
LVEQWDDGDRYVEELIALTGDYRVARAAFTEAAKQRPGRISHCGRRCGCSRIAAASISPLKASYRE